MPLNTYHPNDAQNSYTWGTVLAEAVEVALAAYERVAGSDFKAAAGIAEAIIEAAGGDGVAPDWPEMYRGVEDGSPRYKAARAQFVAFCKAREGRVAA